MRKIYRTLRRMSTREFLEKSGKLETGFALAKLWQAVLWTYNIHHFKSSSFLTNGIRGNRDFLFRKKKIYLQLLVSVSFNFAFACHTSLLCATRDCCVPHVTAVCHAWLLCVTRDCCVSHVTAACHTSLLYVTRHCCVPHVTAVYHTSLMCAPHLYLFF